MNSDNNRNLLLAILLSVIVILGWSFVSRHFFPAANPPTTKVVDGKTVPVANPGADPAADSPAALRNRAVVLRESPRVAIRNSRVAGTISLKGARIDDLVLSTYKETLAKDSPPIRLLSPAGAADAYYAAFGWSGEGVTLPGPDTVWAADATELTPARPVTLSWTNPQGIRFAIRIALDDVYLFTVTQTVANGSGGAAGVRPYALLSRVGHSKDPDSWTAHAGPMGVFNGAANYGPDYKDLDKGETEGTHFASTGGWLGFSDKYWLTALSPLPNARVEANFRGANSRYQADLAGQTRIVPPGRSYSQDVRFFAGAKEVALLDQYEKASAIPMFDRAIDWGWFYWFERPIFWLLDALFKAVGNFGVAILLLTCIIRLLMFPVANKQFASMAGMRVVQPKMKELQERYKDDKARLQQEMLELYKREKVNPLAGCLPIVLQIPIFYALYKVLLLTIEMRHQPFALWLKDLSAPDPMTPVNLFGLLAFTPPPMIGIGVLPILLGITMYLQFKLNPASPDPVQQQVFSIMPWVMMFFFAPLAAGLQLYYVMNNLLSIAQQRFLYSRHPALKTAPTK
ncbi:membrane protein insertase YidC [Sphingomonas jatrophae]|uniref:Membrane protein insertase YidC n=1 Tax=Sphingomonas jatrophae TaxID=1166337 RepID=A0A1I6K7J6_9SPHN|nr:membrane protein insertase YidC [Sphingomonas jatrophae]SFR87209.1 protein translocase subunit yidC [Sphingomonas jatrophae]